MARCKMHPPAAAAQEICHDMEHHTVDEQHISPKTTNLYTFEATCNFLISKIAITWLAA